MANKRSRKLRYYLNLQVKKTSSNKGTRFFIILLVNFYRLQQVNAVAAKQLAAVNNIFHSHFIIWIT